MSRIATSGIKGWLNAEALDEPGLYKTTFDLHHLGNVFIRSLHGGVTGAMIELSAETKTREELGIDTVLSVSSSSIDYLRITRNADLFARATIQRLSRRLSVIDVYCWQDDENVPIARGVVSIKIEPATKSDE